MPGWGVGGPRRRVVQALPVTASQLRAVLSAYPEANKLYAVRVGAVDIEANLPRDRCPALTCCRYETIQVQY